MSAKPQILIAEDDMEDRYFMSSTFDELGRADAVLMLNDGILLMDYLARTGADEVKLIVLDHNMPRLNGTETLRALKSDPKYRDIPVIFFSTSVNEIEKDICLQLGAQDYISKPVRYTDYIDTCRRLYAIAQQP